MKILSLLAALVLVFPFSALADDERVLGSGSALRREDQATPPTTVEFEKVASTEKNSENRAASGKLYDPNAPAPTSPVGAPHYVPPRTFTPLDKLPHEQAPGQLNPQMKRPTDN